MIVAAIRQRTYKNMQADCSYDLVILRFQGSDTLPTHLQLWPNSLKFTVTLNSYLLISSDCNDSLKSRILPHIFLTLRGGHFRASRDK